MLVIFKLVECQDYTALVSSLVGWIHIGVDIEKTDLQIFEKLFADFLCMV